MTTATTDGLLATALRTSDANALKRAHAMKLTPVCTRCGGSGQYSFNQMDGTRCFGCGGNGHVLPRAKDLPALIEAAQAAAADGRLDDYLAALAARRFAKDGMARIGAAWKATATSRSSAGLALHTVKDDDLPGNGAALRAANHLMYDAHQRASKAVEAALVAKASAPDRDALALAAAQAVEDAIAAINAADLEPDAAFLEVMRPKQIAAAERLRAEGYTPSFAPYGGQA